MSSSESIGDADAADLAARQRVVGVVADLGRQVEGDREAGRALREQVAVAAVRFRGVGEAGVLAHRPAAGRGSHLAVEAAREGEGAGRADRCGVDGGDVGRAVTRRERQSARRRDRVARRRGGLGARLSHGPDSRASERSGAPLRGAAGKPGKRRLLVGPTVGHTISWGQALDSRPGAGYLLRPGPLHMFLGIAMGVAGAVSGVSER